MPLTVLEAAVALRDRGSELVDRALQRRVRFDTLHRAHTRNLGRRGSGEAGKLLVVALRAAHITAWSQHYRLAGHELAFPEHQVAIEVDGWASHHDVKHDLTQRPDQIVTSPAHGYANVGHGYA